MLITTSYVARAQRLQNNACLGVHTLEPWSWAGYKSRAMETPCEAIGRMPLTCNSLLGGQSAAPPLLRPCIC